MNLPKNISDLIQGKEYTSDGIGMSKAKVMIFDDFVLKIEKISKQNDETVEVMRWLEGKLPVPKVICYEKDDEYQYLLMSRIKGKMGCDEEYMTNPQELTKRLAESIRMFWNVDVSDCPRTWDLDANLKEARYRVENGLVDVDKAEPSTFGEGGFKDPMDLLLWLENNRPSYEPVFSHGDFCLPNILMNDDGISGFIDLGNSGIGDKWEDIAICYRSLRWNAEGTYGGKVYPDVKSQMLFDALGIEPDMEKIRYFILLDELF
jgi:Aminoglycoside phosphotransferase